MKFGVSIFPTARSISPAALAVAVEQRDFESLFVCEHSHAPATTEAETGRAVIHEFYGTYDPFVALAVAAAVTERIRMGTAVCLVVQRDPIHLAKEVASLDVVSGGRVDFGIGGGWNLPEMRNHGTDPRRRWRLLAERIGAMRAIWGNEDAEYHGELVDFGPLRCEPKPVQQPAPPVLIGGVGARALHRVIEFGDGWIPRALPVDDLRERMKTLADLAAESGRARPPVTVFAAPHDPATLADYRELGVDRVLFQLPSAPEADVLRLLDELAGSTA